MKHHETLPIILTSLEDLLELAMANRERNTAAVKYYAGKIACDMILIRDNLKVK